LLRQLFHTVRGGDWAYGVVPAVDAALLGRYYERFGDHAVAIAQQACYLITGRLPQPTAAPPASRDALLPP
jgi:phosphate transport system protein